MTAPADQHALREALARAEAERDEAVQLAYDLKYAAAGGEDFPGSANAVVVEDVARWRDDAWQRTDALDRAVAQAEARALAAEAENTRLKETVALIRDFAGSSSLVRNDALDHVHAVARRVLATIPPKENPDA